MGIVLSLSSGMVVAFNPCGVALLPAYLAMLLTEHTESERHSWLGGVAAGAAMTGGFVVLFGIAGLIVDILGRALFIMAPITSMMMAIFFLMMAIALWRGRSFGIPLGRLGGAWPRWIKKDARWAFFIYGLSYGLVSMTCSLPVFLAVAAIGFHQSLSTGLIRYAVFALGMGFIVTGLSVVTVSARTVAERLVQSIVPGIPKISAVVMLLGSVYLVWYWIGGPGLHVGLI